MSVLTGENLLIVTFEKSHIVIISFIILSCLNLDEEYFRSCNVIILSRSIQCCWDVWLAGMSRRMKVASVLSPSLNFSSSLQALNSIVWLNWRFKHDTYGMRKNRSTAYMSTSSILLRQIIIFFWKGDTPFVPVRYDVMIFCFHVRVGSDDVSRCVNIWWR